MFRTKIYFGISVIVVLGLLVMLHIYSSLGSMAGYLSTLRSVSVPFSIAALEMEKNSGEYASGVLRYVNDPDAGIREEAGHDIGDFVERRDIYMQLSTTERERRLGRSVASKHEKLLAMGEALMDQRDRLDAVFDQSTDLLERVDVLLDDRMTLMAPDTEPGRSMALAAIANIEAETAEIGFWLSLFRHRPTARTRNRILDKLGEQHQAIARYRNLPLSTEEHRLGAAVMSLHERVSKNVNQLLVGEIALSERVKQLEDLSESMDRIFDLEIQPMLMHDLAEPQQNADQAIKQVQASLRYIIPVYFLIAMVVGLLLIATILRPLRKLADGTEALGRGDLDYRIEARGNDAFAKVGRQFNLMAERLQESTVSRELLETSERQLQRTVVELRQEIVERQQAEQEREKLRRRLQRSETMAAMGRLVAGVAHEVRNPLFGISSTLDAMEASAGDGHDDPRFREVLRREAGRLNSLMSNLLEFGRTPPAGTTIELLRGTLAEAVRSCEAAAAAAAVRIVDRSSEDAEVAMNRDRLLQVHVNLIENAIQHAPPDSTVIVDTLTSIDDEGRHWIGYRVMDAGSGFAAEDLPHLFDPFFTKRRKGTGLGLSIAQRIVDDHHGTIEPGNRAEGGGMVTVRLPVAENDVAA